MILEQSAIDKLKDIIAEENNPTLKLRVFVQGGGCSGFQYGFTLDEESTDDDMNLDYDGVQVLVDSMSWTYLQGSKIQYKESEYGSSFSIENPNATTTCGCGSSFSPY